MKITNDGFLRLRTMLCMTPDELMKYKIISAIMENFGVDIRFHNNGLFNFEWGIRVSQQYEIYETDYEAFALHLVHFMCEYKNAYEILQKQILQLSIEHLDIDSLLQRYKNSNNIEWTSVYAKEIKDRIDEVR